MELFSGRGSELQFHGLILTELNFIVQLIGYYPCSRGGQVIYNAAIDPAVIQDLSPDICRVSFFFSSLSISLVTTLTPEADKFSITPG